MDNDNISPPRTSRWYTLFGGQKLYVGAVAAAGVVLVWAEEHNPPLWYVAQACVIVTLLLFAAMLWNWYSNTAFGATGPPEAIAYNRALGRLLICVFLGYFALVVNATRHDRWVCGIAARAFGYGTLIALAAFFIGGFLGILFGFRPTSSENANAIQTSEKGSSNMRHPHTNLEEIADWLTKLILGAGLVELTRIVRYLPKLGEFIAKGVEPIPPYLVDLSPDSPLAPCSVKQVEANGPVALAVVLFFLASGILYGYLWSRWEFALTSYDLDKRVEEVAKPEKP
jgi:hypothetical protein